MNLIDNYLSEEKKVIAKYISICILLFFTLGILGLIYHDGFDNDYWIDWSKCILNNGLGNIYDCDVDYLPLYHYFLWLYSFLCGNEISITENITTLKLLTLPFHFISGYLILRMISDNKPTINDLFKLLLFYLLNIAVLFNTIIWGQVDAIMSCLLLLSFYFIYNNKNFLSILFLLLAINLKLQAIIFIPFIGLLTLQNLRDQFSIKNFFTGLVLLCLAELLILTPYILAGSLDKIYDVVFNSVGKYPVISMNAYNVWYLLVDSIVKQPDATIAILGLSYKTIGLLLFSISTFIAFIPILLETIGRLVNRNVKFLNLSQLLLIAAFIPLLFFYFNTQMHERYSHISFVFLITYAIRERKWLLPIFFSAAYLLNLSRVNFALNGMVLFEERIVSMLYTITIALMYVYLYRGFDIKKHLNLAFKKKNNL